MGYDTVIINTRNFLYALCAYAMITFAPAESYAKAFSGVDSDDAEQTDEGQASMYDPLEFLNRRIYWFNDKLDKMALKPIAKGYRKAVPEWGRLRVRSFLSNLSTPVDFFNAVLQGDVDQGFTSFWRFYMNTTFGVGGLFDVATLNGLEKRDEDFGQTLGFYGLGSGPYLVLPLLGPSSVRDAVGRFVDSTVDPFNYLDDTFVLARQGVSVIDTREGLLELLDQIEEGSIDPYAAIRSMYLQNQNDKIRNGTTLPSYKMDYDW